MNVKCNRAALFEAVQLASSIVPARTPKEVLRCAKIEAFQDGQKVMVTATDNEITIRYNISQVQVAATGATVVPADRITAILRESGDEMVNLEVEEMTCQVVGQDSRFRIYGYDPADFPVIESQEKDGAIQIRAEVLKKMIHRTVFAAAREHTRYAINGILWERRGKKLRMVGTDGRRLAQIDGELSKTAKEEEQAVIVPVKVMLVLERILHDPEEKIEVSFTGNQVHVSTSLVEVSGNLVQGRFPKYEDVIPSDCDKKVTIITEPLRSAVRRASLLTNDNSKGIQLEFSEGKLCLSSSTPEAGDAEVTMPVEYTYPQEKIGFNPQYLLEVLRVVDDAEVVFEFSDGTRPGILRSGKDFLYVLMPVAV